MKINEIFLSIQGEGLLSGLPTVFIRTTGCNLRCRWCDTKYSYFKGIEDVIDKIFEKVKNFGVRRVCLTGGEPLLQKDSFKLIEHLISEGYDVSVETNGSLDISQICKKVIISLDIKCPSSGEDKKMKFSNLKLLTKEDQCKFIISDERDFQYAIEIIKKHRLERKTNVFFSPVEGVDAKKLVKSILKEKLNVRIGLQLHKIIFGNKKGV